MTSDEPDDAGEAPQRAAGGGAPEQQLDLIANPFQVDVEGRENPKARDTPARVAVGSKTIPERQETVRGRLAQWLVIATIVVIAFVTIALAANWLNSDEVKTLAAVLLSPLVALAGSATGFYFGGKA